MKTKDKIFCQDLPDAFCGALGEALPQVAGMITDNAATADLFLAAPLSVAPSALSPAVPRLNIDLSRPQRIGDLLRRIRQMLDTPAFYMDDLLLGGGLFQPQEKNLIAANGDAAALTEKEVDILLYLARRPQEVTRREDLLVQVWRYQPGVDTHTLETHIYRLRQKLAALPGLAGLLTTDDDGGYRLSLPVSAGAPAAGDPP